MVVSKSSLLAAATTVAAICFLSACGSGGDSTAAPPVVSHPSVTRPSVTQPSVTQPPLTRAPETQPVTETVVVTEAPATIAVDPELFRQEGGGNAGNGVYFRSPSDNVNCGILDPEVDFAGCQAVSSVPSSAGTVCKNAGNSLYMNTINAEGAISRCTSQGVFFTEPRSKILEYGQTISTRGVTCVSTTEGIECSRGSSGFLMSRDRNEVH